ncbi:chromatin assembly factor 1 subunit A-A-like isoform X2 [Argiope bruennichi]|uniref:chromatin assembly factor 1 subunit A-A-like isoform X2 n=1 Tax=Argiope bruennichi TaxID=94029 RepID=UPI002495A10B|nr:chromatin assembly factor 1 subunit A-A-like isoform X2 [Argiope bruennichi]
MPSSGEKNAPVPLKNMDIKSALSMAANRKRKASSSSVPKNQSKNLKLADDKSDDIIEIVDDNVEISAESKENTDLNTTDPQNTLQSGRKVTSEDLDAENKEVCSEKEIEKDSSNESMDEDTASSNELNSSNLNNSLNISELSENVESQNKTESDLNTSVDCNRLASSESKSKKSLENNQTDSKSKKKKKMTPEEAKARAAEREQKQQERLLKKQELETQKKQKKEEMERRRLQKEQEKREKEEEKKEKERIRLEKKEQEEKERLQKLKEKEELKKQRQLMLEQKQEEKKRKEEMRLKREEEKKKAEEEKKKAELEKEQKEKEKQERAKAAFFKFFKKTMPTTPAPQPTESEGAFKPFQVTEDMTLAPVVPAAAQERFDKEKLDRALLQQDEKKLYLDMLKSGNYKDVRQRKRLRQQRVSDADALVLDKEAAYELFFTAKLLQFCENVRPPYWGTWRKKSKVVGPRRPFAQDNIFDYEVDSDDEWDEGGPGESLSGTENEIESEDDYEVDNEFFVPHGYLSPEEEKEEDEEVVNDPEKQQAMLKQKQQEFESERKKKTTELKPIILGCFFENVPELQDNGLRSFFLTYSAEILSETPIPTRFTVKKLQAESAPSSTANSPIAGNLKKNSVPEEAMPHLIRLLHGNVNSRETLIKEFQSFWQTASNSENTSPVKVELVNESAGRKTPTPEMTPEPPTSDKNISKRQLNMTIKKISTYGKCPNPAQKKHCWWVQDEVREKYGLLDIPIPNEWVMSSTSANESESSSNVKNVTSIKEFLIP